MDEQQALPCDYHAAASCPFSETSSLVREAAGRPARAVALGPVEAHRARHRGTGRGHPRRGGLRGRTGGSRGGGSRSVRRVGLVLRVRRVGVRLVLLLVLLLLVLLLVLLILLMLELNEQLCSYG